MQRSLMQPTDLARRAPRPRVLLVDNYDSFTGNLLQLVWCVTGEAPDTVENDRIALGELPRYSHIIIGPGPGTPDNPADSGQTLEVLQRSRVPVLGVCFGFEAMAIALGGQVSAAPRPAHGLIDLVTRQPSPLFAELPETFEAVRYHSLTVAEPSPLRITARSTDGVPMAGECSALGWYGVQFHPESIGTPLGRRIIENFFTLERRSEGPADV